MRSGKSILVGTPIESGLPFNSGVPEVSYYNESIGRLTWLLAAPAQLVWLCVQLPRSSGPAQLLAAPGSAFSPSVALPSALPKKIISEGQCRKTNKLLPLLLFAAAAAL